VYRGGSTGIVLRLPLADARSWDLGGILPEAVSR
jgi:hypothetical protein